MKTIFKKSILALFFVSLTACQAKTAKTETSLAIKPPATHKPNKQFIKVALLLDTSNSMDGLIDQAKAQLWEIVNELSYAKCNDAKPNLQIALYEYGNDNLNGNEGFIRQVLAFSQDLDEISKELFSLTTRGGNEYCGYVIKTALDQLQWGNNTEDLKLIFIAGNEPFNQGRINYKVAGQLAHNKDVTVNTIFCGAYNQGISSYWKDGADITHGNYMAINHNHETVHIASPYDASILQLNNKLNKTYVAYGSYGKDKIKRQAEQDANAQGYSEANAVSRTVSKSSHLYKNASWDLIDASEDASFSYKELKENELPNELQGKTEAEIKTYLDKKRKEREAIQEQIQDLNIKRKQYVAQQQKEGNDNLENAMLGAIKKQAKNKNYKWK
ncbi:VWA domain-containing protein [Lacinutrix sp. C3R15]|uniref:vWA domain-containing protein n=1 Tax=Flavobacteriaceae TaxID=49546 RepID=UPI001C08FD10|nr:MULTISPECIES: VWA domain-containing protein [Flavobacteriaceae]MBU2940045.1 VWA domain-containing protein [Lacinutrix sp. C3R15]MDO6623362.1 VWA domain-containing protein [Oceanihabitans sp. 1_MG-2023]